MHAWEVAKDRRWPISKMASRNPSMYVTPMITRSVPLHSGRKRQDKQTWLLKPLSFVFCLLSSVFCLLSSVFCLLSSVFCLLSSVFCLLSSVFCLLSFVFCLLSFVFCLLYTFLLFQCSKLVSLVEFSRDVVELVQTVTPQNTICRLIVKSTFIYNVKISTLSNIL